MPRLGERKTFSNGNVAEWDGQGWALIGMDINSQKEQPRVGETKTFPNGAVGKWDGQGWEMVSQPGVKEDLNARLIDPVVGFAKGVMQKLGGQGAMSEEDLSAIEAETGARLQNKPLAEFLNQKSQIDSEYEQTGETVSDLAAYMAPFALGKGPVLGAAIGKIPGVSRLPYFLRTAAAEGAQDALIAGAIGDDPMAAGAGAAGVSAALGGAGAVGRKIIGNVAPGGSMSAEALLAGEQGIPVTTAVQSDSAIGDVIEKTSREVPGTHKVWKAYDDRVDAAVVRGIDRISEGISSNRIKPGQLGEFVQSEVLKARKVAGEQFDAVTTAIRRSPAANVPIEMSGLRGKAGEFLERLETVTRKIPELGASEDYNKAIGILRRFANESSTVTGTGRTITDDGITKFVGPGFKEKVPNTITVDEAIELRKTLRSMGEDTNVVTTIGRSRLRFIKRELDAALNAALKKADPDLADAFASVNHRYREVATLMETKAIDRLMKLDEPERVIEILAKPGGSHLPAERLATIVGKDKMKDVQRGMWDYITTSAQKDGVPIGTKAKRIFNEQLDDDMLKQIIPNQRHREEALKLIDAIDDVTIRRQSMGGAAVHGLAGGGPVTTLMRLMEMAPGLKISKILTDPEMTDMALRAARTPYETSAGRSFFARLSAWSMANSEREEVGAAYDRISER